MKKLMLGTAVAALAFVASPALAQDASGVKLNLGGHFKGYLNWVDQDEINGATDETRDLDILRQTEVHFGGETTLDNGLTVGAQIEAVADTGDSFDIDESYVYFSGTWGRVNFGNEDGAAYLLQVAAPSADDNLDGIRQFINPVNYAQLPGAYTFSSGFLNGLDYDNDLAGNDDKITYLTPVFSGFQAGVSYTPDQGTSSSRALDGNNVNDQEDDIGSVYEVAARYEGQFNTVGVIAGAGYTQGDLEKETTVPAVNDDYKEWNVGLDLDIGAFGLGVVYTQNNNGQEVLDENKTWVVGADYTTGPFKIGVSYLDNDRDLTATNELETSRYTGGVVYTYGPGMSFRGSISHVDHDQDVANQDGDATSVLLGTQINF
jgi:predicted porin